MEPKHYAAAVVWDYIPGTRRIHVVLEDVITTYPPGQQGKRQTKFPGGMQREPIDPISVTLSRELAEETFLRYSGELVEIWSQPVFDRVDGAKLDHTKHAFLVPYSECTGELRTVELQDQNDLMFPPYWEPMETAHHKLWRTHQPILVAAMRHFGLL